MPQSPKPARAVVTRAPGRTVHLVNLPSIFGQSIECESSLERDFVLRAAGWPLQSIKVQGVPPSRGRARVLHIEPRPGPGLAPAGL